MIEVTLPAFNQAYPEIFVLGMACLILVVDLFIPQSRRVITYLLAMLTLLGVTAITVQQLDATTVITFNGTFISDPMGGILKLFVFVVTAAVFLYSREYLAQRELFKGEFYVLGLLGMLGMMVMISAHSFLTVYLGLELLSLSLYAMVALNRDSGAASEAAMKYFILGAIASGMLLYGMSLLYGATQSLDIQAVGKAVAAEGSDNVILAFGLVFIVVGIAFKLGAVPFHMWMPDVYHGSPTAITLYISSAPKIAAFAMAMRLLAEGMQGLHADWQQMLVILSVLSLGIGNIVAIAQTNIKRMLAYSTISHVGFLLLGILAGTHDGYAAAMFYTLTYALMALAAFGMIIHMSRSGFEADQLSDFSGLNQRSPWYAFLMLVIMVSLAGVPPTVGFFAKLWVLEAVLDVGLDWLAVVAVVFSIIGAFYYLRIIKIMYFDKPVDDHPISSAFDLRITLSVNALVILLLGLFPGELMSVCQAVIA